MPSKASHRSKRDSYTAQTMRMAYDSVQSGQYTGRQAAAMFKVPYGTLNKKLSGRLPIDCQGAGRPLEMSEENEQKLADYLFVSGRCGYGLGNREILKLTGEFVREENVKTRWINGLPGIYWLKNFLKRNPRGMVRKDNVLSTKEMDPNDVYGFYQDLEHLYEAEKVTLNEAHRFYNLLEISLPCDDGSIEVSDNLGKLQGHDPLKASVLTCIRADGEKLPPLVVFQGKCFACENRRDCNGVVGKISGDVNPLFCYWFENIFIPLLPRNEIQSVKSTILFFEGRSLQINLRLLKLARRNRVFFVKIPPKLTNRFQPLDLKCSSALKSAYNKQLQKWNEKTRQNIEDIQRDKFGNIVGTTWKKSATKSVIVKGFERTGIFPLDKSKFDKNVFSEPSQKKLKVQDISKNINDAAGDLESTINDLAASADACDLQSPKITHVTTVASEEAASSQHHAKGISISSKNGSFNSFQSFESKETSKSNFNSAFEGKEGTFREGKIPFAEEFRGNREELVSENTLKDGAEDLIAKTVDVGNDTRRSERIFKRDASGVEKTSSIRKTV